MIEKITKGIINKKIVEKVLLLFLMMQPILDLYFLFDEEVISIGGFSPSTLIRMGFVFILCLLFLLVWRNKKEFILYAIYIFLVVLYTVFHHINALNFTDFYGGYDFGYSLTSEVFYIIRMLFPLIMIIISYHYEFDNKKIEKLINGLLIISCGSIVASNLLVVSTGSYSKEVIKGSITCWFQAERCNLNYMDLASKGFFLDPNRLSALLILLTTIMIYNFINNPSIKNMIVFFITFLGMFMIGTKVSTYGFIMVSVIALFLYLFFTLIKKDLKYNSKITLFILVIIALALFVLPKSPAINRTFTDTEVATQYNANADGKKEANKEKNEEIQKNIKDKYKKTHVDDAEDKNIEEILKELDKDEKNELLIDFIESNYQNYNLHEHFVFDSYPYTYDPEFWYEVMQLPYEERVNFRKIEYLMLTRVKEINNNPLDNYLGITFIREGNIFDLERDYISHYLTLGIIGLILLISPYLSIVMVCIIKMLLNFKERVTLKNCFYLLGVSICLVSAYFTGNVLDGLIVTLILGFFIGQLINSVFKLGNMVKTERK